MPDHCPRQINRARQAGPVSAAILACAIHAMSWAGARPAAAQDFLPLAAAVAQLADGHPWNARRPDGAPARVTLRPDGSGIFEGPFTRTIGWAAREGAICLSFGFPVGTRCIRLVRQDCALIGHDNAGVALIFSRCPTPGEGARREVTR